MKMYHRNRKIKELFREDVTVEFLMKKYNISKSRVYEILKLEEKLCPKHNCLYYTVCKKCKTFKAYDRFVEKHYAHFVS